LQAEINRLTFEAVLERPDRFDKPVRSGDTELQTINRQLAALQAQIGPLQAELDQLTRQFWVSLGQVRANRYDLSASRYRQAESDDEYYESPRVTMERLLELDKVMTEVVSELQRLVK
jgi:type I restriction enzyme M protein